MSGFQKDLYELLKRKCGSSASANSRIAETRISLGILEDGQSSALTAAALVSLGVDSETISKALSWRDFESFCAGIVRAELFDVKENVRLNKPRAQIDIIARSSLFVITMDCKHWSRLGPATLRTIALAQLRRSHLLRERLKTDQHPIASAILTLYDHQVRFAEGVAVVPVSMLRNFLQNVESVAEMLEVV